MQLNYIKSGSGKNLIILHGLFGMLDNWKAIGKALEKKFTVYLIDQRNHGKSPHTAEHSYKLMSSDLFEFYEQHHIASSLLIGHSMGGKTAMQFALDFPSLVEKLVVIDMGIKRYAPGHETIFNALFSINLNQIHYRSDAESILLEKIPDFSTRQFILKNLSRNPDGTYRWKFNLTALYADYDNYILAPVESDKVFSKQTLFVRGGKSEYILNADLDGIQTLFPNASLATVEEAGHWVHADKPAKLLEVLSEFL